VAELLQLNVDVLVSGNSQAIRAAKEATKTVPIVMVYNADPVADGIVESLARPGGNITGLTTLTRDLRGKRLEVLTEVVPGIARVGILGDANEGEWWVAAFKDYEAAARALKIQLQSLEVRGPNPDLEGAFQAAVKGGASALIALRTSVFLPNSNPKRIADLAIQNRLPSMYAVVFAWWCRARANGLRDADFEPFMQAHFAFVDAKAEQNPDKVRTAAQSIRRWEKYAG
jgi:putative tryptophan/tyrosine transport system substrate-binding protein